MAKILEFGLEAREEILKGVQLLANAVKFTERGGIRVDVDGALSSEGEEVALSIAVHDSGVGIDDDALERIFAPFEQSEARVAQGTGLGMAIAKRMSEADHGTTT